MRDFELEVHMSRWEFKARHHMTASDVESMTVRELLALAGADERARFGELWLGYTETWGAPDLRDEIASTYDSLEPRNILCFSGAQEAIYTAMRVLLGKDDHAIVVVPNYQSAETVPLEQCEVTGVPLEAESDWSLDVEKIARAIRPNTKLVSINFPNNPTGKVIGPEDLEAIVALCRRHGIHLFSDEVYRLLELDEAKRLPQVADIYEKGISVNVMSKAYGLPGLRIGWVASRDTDLLLRLERMKHYLTICNSAPGERLALIALRHRQTILERNRTLLRSNLEALEAFFRDFPALFEWRAPDGGCVAFPRYTGSGGVEDFCEALLEARGVLLLPASIYRSELLEAPADRFRIGFGRRNIAAGLAAMRDFLERRRAERIA